MASSAPRYFNLYPTQTTVVSPPLTPVNSPSGIEVDGAYLATLVLQGANTYTGSTAVYNYGTTLELSGSGTIADSSSLYLDYGTVLDISTAGADQSVNDLTGRGMVLLGNRTLTVNVPGAGTSDTFTGTFNSDGGTGGLTVNGPGTLTLSGNSSAFSGPVTITGGTLDLEAAGAAGTGAITFAPGGNGTLEFTLAADPANVVKGFIPGQNAIDLLGDASATAATLGANNVLSITGGSAGTETINLDPTADYTGDFFTAVPDAAGTGTAVQAVADTLAIAGLPAAPTGSDTAPANPFAGVTITDNNTAPETATVTLSSTTDGALSDSVAGTVQSDGSYTVSGTAAQVQAALQGLVFTPVAHQVAPGESVSTEFNLSLTDGTQTVAGTSSLTVTASADAPVVSNSAPNQIGTANTALQPFTGVTISDPDTGTTEAVTITLTDGATGTATDANGVLAGTGLTRTGVGTYQLTADTAANVTAALQALSFTPTSSTSSVTTNFAIADTSSDGQSGSTTDTVTTRASAPGLTAPAAPTLGLSVAGGGTVQAAIINSLTPTIVGSTAAGATVAFSVGAATAGNTTADGTTGAFSTTVTPSLNLGEQDITGVASNTAGSSPTSSPLDLFVIAAPVNGISTTDNNSLQIGTLLNSGYSLQFVSGTEAATLVDGTLSVGQDTNEAYIQRLYEGLLGRGGDEGGLGYYDQQMSGGVSQAQIATQFLSDPEYTALHGNQTDAQFVTNLYQGMLGRTASTGEMSYWTGAINQIGQGGVAAGIANSAESKAYLAADTAQVFAPNSNDAAVYQLFQTGLNREVDLGSLSFFGGALNGGASPLQIAESIANSAEFQADHASQGNADFVASLYENGLGRAPDTGAQGFIDALNNGTADRGAVLLTIASSAEASAHLTRNV